MAMNDRSSDSSGKWLLARSLGRSRWPRRVLAIGGLALAAAGLGACNSILGIEEATLRGTGAGGPGGGGGTGGTAPECTSATECNDQKPCTVDSCDLDTGKCVHTPAPDGPLAADQQTAGDCKRAICSGGQLQSEADAADLPVDNQECTNDVCTGSTPSNTNKPDGTPCSQGGGKYCYVKATASECVECYDNSQCTPPKTCTGGGTPYVCGCTPVVCETLSCGWGNDTKCQSGQKNCNNNAHDGTETDIDCGGKTVAQGGTCDLRCGAGKSCTLPSDCASGSCVCNLCDGAGGCG